MTDARCAVSAMSAILSGSLGRTGVEERVHGSALITMLEMLGNTSKLRLVIIHQDKLFRSPEIAGTR